MDKTSCLDLEEQAESSMTFRWWFPAQQQDCWQFFPQHPIPASFVWFLLLKTCILPRLSHLFFAWITDVYSAPILFFSSPSCWFEAFERCSGCEDTDALCDGCLSLALLPLPLLSLPLWLWFHSVLVCWGEKCAVISRNGYSPPGSWWRGLRRNWFAPWVWKCRLSV